MRRQAATQAVGEDADVQRDEATALVLPLAVSDGPSVHGLAVATIEWCCTPVPTPRR